jgi:hypothetical protein
MARTTFLHHRRTRFAWNATRQIVHWDVLPWRKQTYNLPNFSFFHLTYLLSLERKTTQAAGVQSQKRHTSRYQHGNGSREKHPTVGSVIRRGLNKGIKANYQRQRNDGLSALRKKMFMLSHLRV